MKCSLEVTSLRCFEPMPANALMATSLSIVSPQGAYSLPTVSPLVVLRI